MSTVGTYHLAAAGETSWHGFATEIFRLREAITGVPAPVISRTTADAFRSAAKRPGNSRLALEAIERSFGLTLPDWKKALEQVMRDAGTPLADHLMAARAGTRAD